MTGRTREEIEQEMLALKNQFPQLAGLNSNSSEAEWKLWINIVSQMLHAQDNRLIDHTNQVEAIAARAVGTSTRWYQAVALQYQQGYQIEWTEDELRYGYAVIDEDAKVVKRCAIEEPSGTVRIKVAKLDSAGLPEPLDAAELAGFQSYMEKISGAGDFLEFVNQEADSLKIFIEVDYDPQISQVAVRTNVEEAVTSFIANLPFHGQLRLTYLIDQIQTVEGVIGVRVTQAEGQPLNESYTAFTSIYIARAGHMKIDPAFPLSNTVTYQIAQ